MQVDNEPSGAVFADDRTHRLYLWRRWNQDGPWVMFIGLNPSTADERLNDPIRCDAVLASRLSGATAACLCVMCSLWFLPTLRN